MIHDKLTDYQIAEAFGSTLSLIYKDKMIELNEDLQPFFDHRARIQIPQVPKFHQWFFEQSIPSYFQQRITSIDHINKIRKMWKKMKNTPEGQDQLNVQKARDVSIEMVYGFKRKGKNVSCPFHEDKHPSASIKYNKLVCFQCGYRGDSITLFMKLNNVGFKEAVEALNKI